MGHLRKVITAIFTGAGDGYRHRSPVDIDATRLKERLGSAGTSVGTSAGTSHSTSAGTSAGTSHSAGAGTSHKGAGKPGNAAF